MLKKLLPITVLLLLVVSASAIAQVKIGYLDTQKVLNELPEKEQLEKQLSDFIESKRAELTQRATAYQDELAEFDSNNASMSRGQMEQKEQELEDQLTALEEFDQSIRLQIQQKRDELLSPIFNSIDRAISDIAESENIDFVLNKSVNAGDTVVFYASANQLDLTQRVIDQLTSTQ